jgi:hypothetical protein
MLASPLLRGAKNLLNTSAKPGARQIISWRGDWR